jgi:hypothetical protein
VNRFILAYVEGAKYAKAIENTLNWKIMGESIYILQVSGFLGFLFVFIAEFGILQFLSRPLIKIMKWIIYFITYPFKMCCGKKQVRRKAERLDDEDVDAQAVLAIEDKDPELEEKRIESI